MGLDMYLTGKRYFMGIVRKCNDRKAELFDLGYWRKHPNLRGFIVNTFANGKDECQPIHLDVDDIRAIITAIESEGLPHTTGFFFGESDGSEKPADIEIFNNAIQWLKTPDPDVWRSVYYQASW